MLAGPAQFKRQVYKSQVRNSPNELEPPPGRNTGQQLNAGQLVCAAFIDHLSTLTWVVGGHMRAISIQFKTAFYPRWNHSTRVSQTTTTDPRRNLQRTVAVLGVKAADCMDGETGEESHRIFVLQFIGHLLVLFVHLHVGGQLRCSN